MEKWLTPDGFTALNLPAVPDVGVVLPYSEYSPSPFIIGYLEEELWAVFCCEQYRYEAMKCTEAVRWQGLYVPNVRFEIDLTSAFDIQYKGAPRGSLIRDVDSIYMASSIAQSGFSPRTHLIRLVTNLTRGTVNDKIAFSRWKVVVGDGDKPTVLMNFDVLSESGQQ